MYKVFDPGNQTFEFLAWDLMRMFRKTYRHLPSKVRDQLYGVYPVTSVDIAYRGFQTVGQTSVGVKDRDGVTKVFGKFQKQHQRVFKSAGVEIDKDNTTIKVYTVKGNKFTAGFVKPFKEKLVGLLDRHKKGKKLV